jgi:hypothetical protein
LSGSATQEGKEEQATYQQDIDYSTHPIPKPLAVLNSIGIATT